MGGSICVRRLVVFCLKIFLIFEFIIIDDGSTDNSLEIIKSFTDDRIKITSEKIGA